MSGGWKKDALSKRKTVVLRKSVGSVLLYHYFSASFLKQNIRSWRHCIIVISNVPLEAAHKLWLNSESCPWALLWGRNHRTTANALQSPTVNRFWLSEILEYDCHSKFSLSRSFGTTDKWDEIKATTAETNVSSTVCLTTSKDTGRVWAQLL